MGDGQHLRLSHFVSIPERVWGGLEPTAGGVKASQTLFQSLRGFGVGWSGGPLKALLYLVFEVQMREPFKCSSFALGIRLLAPSQKT